MIPGCCCGRDLCDDYGFLIVEPKWYANYPVYPTPSLDFWISSSTGYTGATVGISGGWTGTVAGLTCISGRSPLGVSFGQYMPAEWQNWETKFLGTHPKGTYTYPGNLEGRDTGNFHYELKSTLILPSKYSQYQIENKIVNVGSLFNNKDIPFTDLAKAYEHVPIIQGVRDSNNHAWTQITTTGATVYALPNKPFCEWCATEGGTFIERNILPGKTGDYARHTFTINNVVFTDNLPISTSEQKPRNYDIFYTVKQDVPIDSSLMRSNEQNCLGPGCIGATLDVDRCLEWAVDSTGRTSPCCAVSGDTRSDDLNSTALISAARYQNNYKFFVFRVKLQKENIPDTDQNKIILQNTYINGIFDFDYVVPKRTEECAAKCTAYNNQYRDPNNPYAPLDVVFSYALRDGWNGPNGPPAYDPPYKDRCYDNFDVGPINIYGGGIIYDCRPANYELDFNQYWNICYFTDSSCYTYLNTTKRHPVFGEICKEAASTTFRTNNDCCAGYGGSTPYYCFDCQLIEIISLRTEDWTVTRTARELNPGLPVVGTCTTTFSSVKESVVDAITLCCDRMDPNYDACVRFRQTWGDDLLAIGNDPRADYDQPVEGGSSYSQSCGYDILQNAYVRRYRSSSRKQVTSCPGGSTCVRSAYTLEWSETTTASTTGNWPCGGCQNDPPDPPRTIPAVTINAQCAYPPDCPYDSIETKQPPKVLKVDATESTQYEYNPLLMYTENNNYTVDGKPDYQKYLKYQMNFLKQEFPIIPNPDPYYPGAQYNRNYILVTENPQCTSDKMDYYKYSSLTKIRFLDLSIALNTPGFGRCNIREFKPTCQNAIQYRQDLESMGLHYKRDKNYQPWNNLKLFYGYSIASTATGITYEKLNNLVLNKNDNIYSYDFLKNNLNLKLP
jgi:hypothetical protein